MAKPNIDKKSIETHRNLRGKIEVSLKAPLDSPEDLKIFYTPGVGAVARHLTKTPKDTTKMTIKGNSVLIVSDGSAVLGLGNIGPEAALPVMEGKAMIFKKMAGINAFPVVLKTQDPKEIIKTIENISPAFGGINIEDISAPRCFEIERALINSLDIPVMHDDQHGTAIVVLAGLINAMKVAEKKLRKSKIVILGAGAAGTAIAKFLRIAGVKEIVVVDRKGIIARGRKNLNKNKKELALITNPKNLHGRLTEALTEADALIGVSGSGLIKKHHIQSMAEKPIVFALSNPTPEVMPEGAKKWGAYVIATGRSDYPNQLNNALAFPGIFRGALDNNVRRITENMKLRAARNLASLVKKPSRENIIPSIFNPAVVKAIARSIR